MCKWCSKEFPLYQSNHLLVRIRKVYSDPPNEEEFCNLECLSHWARENKIGTNS